VKRNGKEDVITFKVDRSLAEAMESIPNRSAFIRDAIRAALGGVCPLCSGTGALTTQQQRHWEIFARHHALARCSECEAYHLVCEAEKEAGGDGGMS